MRPTVVVLLLLLLAAVLASSLSAAAGVAPPAPPDASQVVSYFSQHITFVECENLTSRSGSGSQWVAKEWGHSDNYFSATIADTCVLPHYSRSAVPRFVSLTDEGCAGRSPGFTRAEPICAARRTLPQGGWLPRRC